MTTRLEIFIGGASASLIGVKSATLSPSPVGRRRPVGARGRDRAAWRGERCRAQLRYDENGRSSLPLVRAERQPPIAMTATATANRSMRAARPMRKSCSFFPMMKTARQR
jgi:hypothetical protein